MIEKHSIEEVMQTSDIIEVIADFISLKKRGVNYLGNCPFHHEKTPSFTISPTKQIYKCFGCGKAGNIITFLQEHEKLSYVESIRYLADKYNIALDERQVTEEKKQIIKKEESFFIINNAAQKFFTNALHNSEEGTSIGLSYFIERGLSIATIDKFLLGFNSSNGQDLYNHLQESGYQKELVIELGLIKEKNGYHYDTYRDRVVFPIQNSRGKIIGFGARILNNQTKVAKYLNSPENEIYQKRKELYGLFQAAHAISKAGNAILTEGYMDVISLVQAGLENTIASSGTSLTAEQLKTLSRFTKNIIILYDNDDAGINATSKAIDLCLENGFDVHIVTLDEGEDPDSYVKKYGGDALKFYIDSKKMDFIKFRTEIEFQNNYLNFETKPKVVDRIVESIAYLSSMEDMVKRSAFIRRTSEVLQVDEESLVLLVNRAILKNKQNPSRNYPQEEASINDDTGETYLSPDTTDTFITNEGYKYELGLIRVLLSLGNQKIKIKEEGEVTEVFAADYVFDNIEGEHLENDVVIAVFELYKKEWQEFHQVDNALFLYHENKNIINLCVDALQFPHTLSDNWKNFHITPPDLEEANQEDVQKVVMYFTLRYIKNMFKSIMNELKDTEDQMKIKSLLTQLHTIKQVESETLKKFGTVILK